MKMSKWQDILKQIKIDEHGQYPDINMEIGDWKENLNKLLNQLNNFENDFKDSTSKEYHKAYLPLFQTYWNWASETIYPMTEESWEKGEFKMPQIHKDIRSKLREIGSDIRALGDDYDDDDDESYYPSEFSHARGEMR